MGEAEGVAESKNENTETKCAARVKELEERLMRLQAEFENYKKRTTRENEAIKEQANADAMLKLLSIVDDLDIAMEHMGRSSCKESHKECKEFMHGIELIYVKLLDMLKREGIERMKALGESFDPYKHEAIRQTDGEDGRIIEVLQKGYTLRGKVLRHAKVVVGQGRGKAGEGEKECSAGKEER